MESAAVLRSFNYPVGTVLHMRSVIQRPCTVALNNKTSWPITSKSQVQGLAVGGKLIPSPRKGEGLIVSCVKTSDTVISANTDVPSDSQPQGSLEKNALHRSTTFPNGFEELVLQVCDETEVAELKLKIGDFQMHLKRNIGATKFPTPVVSPTSPPIPSEPMIESTPASSPPTPPKPSTEKVSPFTNVPMEKSAKLAALEASGSSGYVLVSSPTVGSFRRGRTVKGKTQPPICKQGDVIKEGQVIGYLDQFGTELPVKSDVAGEVLEILFDDGEAVGYGDPLIAVLPSFHDIK
ncbi:hypothetical protein NMG60_11012018 [Bertholletia excelsa]